MSTQQPLQTAPSKPASLPARVWQQPSGKVGAVLTGFMVLAAIFGYLFAETITGYSPTESIGQPFESTGVFGTDGQGRSVASRVLAGGLALLWYATAATAIGVVLGTLLGAIAGYVGGVVDFVMMRINDAMQAFPPLVLALLAIVIFGPSGLVLTLVIGLAQASRVVRVARSATQSVTSQDYVLAAQLYGMPRRQIFSREILPNITGPVAVEAGLRFASAIATIAALSFVGFGVQPPSADWALMINENLVALPLHPWGVILPVIAVAILTVGTTLLAYALAQAGATTATHIRGRR